ncbi:MAG: type II secretion system protein GspJ [Gammaproteobacteria bacterium]|uniref:Type II secretion system protein J n=1 Tax=SAR86 cluster bacterium TaxID=2030880 RepID=A0A368C5E4_9GAMM|nr:MAG: prepilin-type N-terminal cleavage/methylation domain-containing protein [SAR86 cluster bacterium]
MKHGATLLKNNSKGFTLIEVLVSIVILSIIAVVSTNFLQSSVEARDESSKKLQNIKELNIASSILRRDIRQIINVPMRDYFGNNLKGNFIADTASDSLVFTTLVNASYSTSRIRRVEYLYQNNALIRKQYYADNPYSYDEFFETTLLEDISEIEFSYLGTSKWYASWPIDLITQRKIPELIKITFTRNNLEYEWVINPNIDYVYKK